MVNHFSYYQRRRKELAGTTLVELMVTMFLFTLIVTTIMTFYMQSTRVTSQQDSISDAYRRAITLANKIETYTAYAKIYSINYNTIIFAPPDTLTPVEKGLPIWKAPQALKIATQNKKICLQHISEDAKTTTLIEFPPDDYISFSKSGHILFIHIKCSVSQNHTIEMTRSILLENTFTS